MLYYSTILAVCQSDEGIYYLFECYISRISARFYGVQISIYADAKVTVGKAEAKADATAQIFGSDGKLDAQLGASAKAEAIAAEVEGSAGINVLGGEVGVKGSVNVGIGAHADVGYRDGVVKVDIGASLGVGASVALEVDVGGMVDTITDTATAAWEGVKSGWKAFTSWF